MSNSNRAYAEMGKPSGVVNVSVGSIQYVQDDISCIMSLDRLVSFHNLHV